MTDEKHTDPTNERIMDSAQRLIQLCGYNGFSYRDVADEVGIRSASIHYHFPTKADLGQAVARRYTAQFLQQLSAARAEETDSLALLERYVSLFRAALFQEGRMCLCGILGAEILSLPEEVASEARHFIETTTDWLEDVIRTGADAGRIKLSGLPRAEAQALFASIEGAMIYAKAIGNFELFDEISNSVLKRFQRS